METVTDFISLGSEITADGDCSYEVKRHLLLGGGRNYDKPRRYIAKQKHYFADKGPSSQNYGSSSSHVWMWELDHKEGWAPRNWCFWAVVLEKTLETPLDCKEIQTVNSKRNQSWIFTRRTGTEAEALILWPLDVKSQIIGKDLDAGKDRSGEEKGAAEDEMVRQHHQLERHEFEQTLGDSEGRGSLACCCPWGHRVRHDLATEQQQNRSIWGFPGGASGKEHTCQCRRHKRHGLDPWGGKIPWRRAR